jgi:hypothetical protein
MPPQARKSKGGPKKAGRAPWKPRASPERRASADQNIARAKAIEALYRPFQEAAQAELEKTESGRAILEEANAFVKELGKLYEDVTAQKTTSAEAGLWVRERQKRFIQAYGEQLFAAYGKQAHLQPSVAAVARILRPEMPERTTWISETSDLGSMLLRPKVIPQDAHSLKASAATGRL